MIGLLLQKNFMQKFCKRAQKELAPILPSADKFYAKITISFVNNKHINEKNLPKDFQRISLRKHQQQNQRGVSLFETRLLTSEKHIFKS